MRNLNVTEISDTVGMPVKAGTWEHLQLAYKEILTSLGFNLIGPAYSNTIPYVLYGCVNTGSGLNYIISAGAILFNGEVYLVDQTTFTADTGEVAVGDIVTTSYINGDRADPVEFTDGGGRNVHEIKKVVFSSGPTNSTIFDLTELQETKVGITIKKGLTLGSSYTVTFEQDKLIFFTTASVDTTITFGFTNAVIGAVVRLKWTWGAGRTLTITPPGGAVAYEEGGDTSRAADHVNSMYFIYLGQNSEGDNEVGYSISQIA